MMRKITLAVHKFSSCDGCQLALLNMGETLVELAERIEIKHFAEAGVLAENAKVDIAFVEGSVVTQADEARIQKVRDNSEYLITMGACATSGGIQALKNLAVQPNEWIEQIYPHPKFIDSLDRSSAIKAYVDVDFELWGCPINSKQITAVITQLLSGVVPWDDREKLCIECKRQGHVCTFITQGTPCMGPVTRNGCGALCPEFGRACYGCYGAAALANNNGLIERFEGLGLLSIQIQRRFSLIHPDPSAVEPVDKQRRRGKA